MRTPAALLGLLALLPACGAPAEPPPHVLLVVVDTLRADHLSCYGYRRPTSPHIDQLAARGVRFEACTAQSSWTGPSMVSMFTSRELAGERLEIPADAPTLVEPFADAGWRTGAFVVNPLVHAEENGYRRGFERFEPDADVMEVRRWLLAGDGRPTFTYVHWVDPHDPYGPAPEYEHFLHEGGGLPLARRAELRALAEAEGLVEVDAELDAISRAIDGYDDDVRLVDAKVGVLTDGLRTEGTLDRSVVVLAVDHGEGLWDRVRYPGPDGPVEADTLREHLFDRHGAQLYQELVRVPLVVFAPGRLEPGVVSDAVRNVDVAPTLLDLADLRRPAGMQGDSLVPRVTGATVPVRDAVSVTALVRSLTTPDGWKLVLPTEEGRRRGLATELFDLQADPREKRDVAAREPGRVAELSARLEARLARALPAATGGPSAANVEAMRALGYADDGAGH